jgi:hypothetical protein
MASKRKTKAKTKPARKPENPPIPSGANRRAIAVVSRNLHRKLDEIDARKEAIRKEEKKIWDNYKNDTGYSLEAARHVRKLAKMDPAVRDTLIKDQLAIIEDLALQADDMPLFAQAAKEQAAVSAMENEMVIPGYIEGMGRDAFAARRTMDQHPFPADANDTIEKWQAGFIKARTEKDEADQKKQDERAAKRAEAVAARAAAKAGRDGEAQASAE